MGCYGVGRQVSVNVVLESTNGALAAKAATQTIPIVFMQGADAVRIGLVNSLNRPGGNVTGFDLLLAETAGKRLELLLDLVPRARSIAYLHNPTNPVFAESEMREVQVAAQALGVRLLLVKASRPSEFETAFADVVQQRADALQVSGDGFLLTHPDEIVALAARNAVPAIYAWRQAMAVGGLVSYGTNILDAWRQAGIYTGRILRGEKPADLAGGHKDRADHQPQDRESAQSRGANLTAIARRRGDRVTSYFAAVHMSPSCHTFMSFPQAWPNQSSIAFCLDSLWVKSQN